VNHVIFALCIGIVPSLMLAETKIALNDLPAAVQSAVKEQTKGAQVLGFSKENEKGQTTYEVETKVNGKTRDLTFDGAGNLIEMEQEVQMDSIPERARRAIEKRAAIGSVRRLESVTHGDVVRYEATVTMSSGKNTEISVDADGTPRK
jgi:uncharacterized membrane protein YkoI